MSGTTVNFTYNADDSGAPAMIRVFYEDTTAIPVLDGSGEAVAVEMTPGASLSSRILLVVFHDDFFPLELYCDGSRIGIPVITDGRVSILTALRPTTPLPVVVYPVDVKEQPQTYLLSTSGFEDGGTSSIGVVIVGTSGLTDPNG